MNLNGVSAAAVQTSFHFHCLSFERGRYRGLDPDAGSIHPPAIGWRCARSWSRSSIGGARRRTIRPNRSSQLTHTRSGELIDGVSYWWEEGGAQDVV